MAIKYRTKGIVFKKSDRSEADRVFNIFTDDHGRLELHGKAIRKINSKLKSGIDLFCLSEVEFIEGKNRKTLTDTLFIKKFDNIFSDLNKLETAKKISAVLDEFVRGQEKDEDIFNLLNETFDRLNDLPKESRGQKMVFYYFLWNFLSCQGYKPEVEKCNACKEKLNPYNIFFSFKNGGVVCKKCLQLDASGQKINSDVVKLLRLIFNKNWNIVSRLKIGNESMKLFSEVSINYYSYVLPGKPF